MLLLIARVTLAAAVVIGMSGCSELAGMRGGVAQTIDDANISDEVARDLAAHRSRRSLTGVEVDTRSGTVYLRGTVPNQSAEDIAVLVARDVRGVRGVTSYLEVGSGSGRQGEAPRDVDERITAEVRRRIASDRARAALVDVEITTRRGVVKLSGQVPDEAAKRRAGELAKQTADVRRVIDRIEIRESAGKSPQDLTEEDWDAVIALSVLKALADENGRAYSDVDVKTTKRTVYLTGTVAVPAEKARAGTVAREVGGVNRVVNRLRTSSQPR